MSDYAHAIMRQIIRANADDDLMQEIAQAIDDLPEDFHVPSEFFDFGDFDHLGFECAEEPSD
jgi:hypothetical protein